MKIFYNKNLKKLATNLRNNSTKAEIKLWVYLKNKQMMHYDFHRQKPIETYIVDFFCNKLKLAIEIDGYTHEFNEVIEKDNLKTKRLHKLGITVLRFSDEEVINNTEGVVVVIKEHIKELEIRNTPPAPLDRGEVKPQAPLDRGEDRNLEIQ